MAKNRARRAGPGKRGGNRGIDPRAVFRESIDHFKAGRLSEARAGFKRLKKRFPDVADSSYFLSLIASRESRFGEAREHLDGAITLQPANPAFICQAGHIARLQDDHATAIRYYRKALEIDQDNLEALINLGISLRRTGALDDAVQIYEQAMAINDSIPELHNNLGSVLLLKNRFQDALEHFQQAVKLNPGFAGAHHNLGRCCMRMGNMDVALSSLREAVRLAPDNDLFLHDLAACLGQVRLPRRDESIEAVFIRCLQLERCDGGTLGQAVGIYLVEHTAVGRLAARLRHGTSSLNNEDLEYLANPLLQAYMQREQVCNPQLEHLLVHFRGFELDKVLHDTRGFSDKERQLLTDLSCQCFYNEFVYPETVEENRQLQELEKLIIEELDQGLLNETALMVYSCYRPLFRQTIICEKLNAINIVDSQLQRIVRTQITEPGEERGLRTGIPALGLSNDEISSRVREQYEENPYPRWFQVDSPPPMGLREYITNLLPGAVESLKLDVPSPRILVAGCGTGLQPVRDARRFPHADITAVDLSLSSLAYAMRMSAKLGHDQIHYFQGDILELEHLPGRFHFIECFGVLHHMLDPLDGWSRLREKLEPGGVMRVGLYSYKARGAVRAAREHIASKNYTTSVDDIRRCRQDILSLDPGHPAWKLRFSPDFYSTSEVRDLIFHAQEHQLDIPWIQNALEQLQLHFLGFEFPDSASLNRFREQYPEDGAELCLDYWDSFEEDNTDTFVSQYVVWATTA